MTIPAFSKAPSTASLAYSEEGNCVSGDDRDPTDFEGCLFPRDLSLRFNPLSTRHSSFPHAGELLSVSPPTEPKDNAMTSGLHSESVIFDVGDNSNNITSTTLSASNFHSGALSSQFEREELSRSVHERLSQLISAREAPDNQRWAQNPVMDGAVIRLVAGSIPILSDGRILMITSRSKGSSFLVLPKGGWELDESLEEGALRETFEEAGALGILGPPLPSFLLVSGKNPSTSAKINDLHQQTSMLDSEEYSDGTLMHHVKFCSLSSLVPLTSDVKNSHRGHSYRNSHTWMTFFPLYVTQIMRDWPESTRQRRAYPIQGTVFSIYFLYGFVIARSRCDSCFL
jgi:8-oxo-dGTP pyrophosphatase MutT (NUDIX family)